MPSCGSKLFFYSSDAPVSYVFLPNFRAFDETHQFLALSLYNRQGYIFYRGWNLFPSHLPKARIATRHEASLDASDTLLSSAVGAVNTSTSSAGGPAADNCCDDSNQVRQNSLHTILKTGQAMCSHTDNTVKFVL